MSSFGDKLTRSMLVSCLALLVANHAVAQEEGGADVDRARDALQEKETDVTEERNLEEVFQATEKQYSLLKAGQVSVNFSADYSYYRDDRIDIAMESGSLSRFRIENDAQHTFGADLSIDYGVRNNLTFNTRLPVVYKYETQRDASLAALGDVSFGLRYQPFPVRIGATNVTLFTTLSTATGDSPYKINVQNEVSSGKGYYSLGAGVSMSKIIDPVVLFGSIGYTHAFDATGLNQTRGSRILRRVDTGDSLNFSFGLAYSLSYEVSISASYQQSYNFETQFRFRDLSLDPNDVPGQRVTIRSEDATSSVVNFALGLRSARNRVLNFNFGFGLTEDSPDVLMGISVPVDIQGFKPGV